VPRFFVFSLFQEPICIDGFAADASKRFCYKVYKFRVIKVKVEAKAEGYSQDDFPVGFR
jgi:hypothetical protein